MEDIVRISPQYRVQDWRSIRFESNQDWHKAVDIFEDRIQGRFLDQVAAIEGKPFAGFAVLALDCLLIETLQQFFLGVKRTPDKQAASYFVRFFTETSFKTWLDEESAKVFFKQIRCGILHQGETGGSSRVVTGKLSPLMKHTGDGKGLIVNRRLFHVQLRGVFDDYLTRLRDGQDHNLRENFRKKMDYICDVTSLD